VGGLALDRVPWLLDGLSSGGPAIAASVLFLGFGAASAWLLGLRGLLLIIVAALPSAIGLLVLTSHVLGLMDLQTSLVTNSVAALLAAATIGGAQRLWMRRAPARPRSAEAPHRLVWAGAGLGAAVAMAVWLAGIGEFTIPPQGNDDIWHGYVVERLTHMPAITASTVAPLYPDRAEPVAYYQYGLHLSGALIHEVTGVSIAEILNGAWVVHIGLILPFGIAAAAWRLVPDRPWVAFWSGALSAGVSIFPYVTNGILPYTAALAMTPALLALALAFIDERLQVPSLVVALAALGVFVTHPVGALAAAILIGLVTIEHLVRPSLVPDWRRAVRRLGMLVALTTIASLPWILASRGTGLAGSAATTSVGGALPAGWMLLGLASPWTPPQPMLAFLTIAGVVTSILSRRAIGLTAGLLAFGALSIGVIAGEPILSSLAGPWYAGWHRLMAVVGLVVPILAALGITTLIGTSGRLVARLAPTRASLAPVLAAVVIAIPAAATTAYDAARAQSIVRTAWHASGLITAQDIELLQDLATRVGPTDKVLNSPGDGSSWMYALFEVVPVLPYSGGSNFHLPDLYRGAGIYGNPAVSCRTLAATGATFAVVKEVLGDDPTGVYDISPLVDRYPDLFKVVVRTDTGTAYRIDQPALVRCANA
jgi:hypothetical protein